MHSRAAGCGVAYVHPSSFAAPHNIRFLHPLTLIYSNISIVRLCLQYLILILQWFPYAEVALWLVQPRRFPSGIWFKSLHVDRTKHSLRSSQLPRRSGSEINGSRGLWNLAHPNGTAPAESMELPENQQEEKTTLVSTLGVETAGIGTSTLAS